MILLNGQPVPVTIFPDKTSQVWKLPENILNDKDIVRVKWQFDHEGEFMHLAQLKSLLDNCGVPATLELTYLPYGRQDKQVDNYATFALHTFSKLLNSLNFLCVVCRDPHSDFGQMAINNFRPIYPAKQVEQVAQITECSHFCYPDEGAHRKYTKVYDLSYRPYLYGEKVRDQLTGNIMSYSIVGDPRGLNILIVDDICDGGMTFRILAKDLLAKGAKSVVLFVTHGIFSKGLQVLKDSGIQRIFTQDGEASEDNGQITYRRL